MTRAPEISGRSADMQEVGAMADRAFLVQWDSHAAEAMAKRLSAEGWSVEWESSDGGRAYKMIRANPPNLVLIDLSLKPNHGREVARSLRNVKATRDLPILFIDGHDDAKEAIQSTISGAKFSTSEDLCNMIKNF